MLEKKLILQKIYQVYLLYPYIYIKKYNLNVVYDFFRKYPEEKRGRKNFKDKEIQNIKALIYEEIFQKAIAIKADCIGSIKENVSKEKIMITVSFFRKNE